MKRISLPIKLLFALALMLAVTATVFAINTVTIDGNMSDWNDEFCLPDSDGAQVGGGGDPGQKDLTLACIASNFPSPSPANVLFFRWNWDITSTSGNNTADGCVILDVNLDTIIDYSLCVTVGGNPAAYQSHQLYRCDGQTKTDRCAGGVAVPSSAVCAVEGDSNTNPFGSDLDTAAECSLPLADMNVAPGAKILMDACSFPSTVPNSDPSDCIIIPGSGRIGADTSTGSNGKTTPTPVRLLDFAVSGQSMATEVARNLAPIAGLAGLVGLGIVVGVHARRRSAA